MKPLAFLLALAGVLLFFTPIPEPLWQDGAWLYVPGAIAFLLFAAAALFFAQGPGR